MARLFLFIVNFGSRIISFNELGNVLIRNHVIDKRSNILDLLQACVHVTVSKPFGYKAFVEALKQTNIPRHFILEGT